MDTLLLTLIALFGTASYVAGIWQMLRGTYRPSVFSRVVWLLLAINSFAGVLISQSTTSSILLSLLFLVGNACVCVLSFWKGTRSIGRLEYVCLALLAMSGIIWIVADAPLLNLGLSLVAHFIGAIPTYRRVWSDGSTESTAFWSLFFIASLLSILESLGRPLSAMLFPVYFALFDGSMTALSLRKPKT